MRVTLTQDELFEAIATHLTDKLNLDSTASIEISFTAGRSPKGYTADVDITYPKSEAASRFTAKDHVDEPTSADAASVAVDTAEVVTGAAISGAVPTNNLFNS